MRAQVDAAARARLAGSGPRPAWHRCTRSVSKKASCTTLIAQRRQAPRPASAARACTRPAMRLQALRAVVDGVHAGHDGQQHLGRADVAGGLLAPDVLLAGLQRHAEAGLPSASFETPMMRPGIWRLYVLAGGEEGGVRAAEAHRHAEALGCCPRRCRRPTRPAAVSSVRASRSAATATSAPPAWAALAERRGSRPDGPSVVGVLDQHAEQALGRRRSKSPGRPTCTSMPSGSARVCTTAIVCGWQSLGHEEAPCGPWPGHRDGHVHRLGGGRGLVEQRGVGDRQRRSGRRPSVWKLSSASRRPWAISAWYGV